MASSFKEFPQLTVKVNLSQWIPMLIRVIWAPAMGEMELCEALLAEVDSGEDLTSLILNSPKGLALRVLQQHRVRCGKACPIPVSCASVVSTFRVKVR